MFRSRSKCYSEKLEKTLDDLSENKAKVCDLFRSPKVSYYTKLRMLKKIIFCIDKKLGIVEDFNPETYQPNEYVPKVNVIGIANQLIPGSAMVLYLFGEFEDLYRKLFDLKKDSKIKDFQYNDFVKEANLHWTQLNFNYLIGRDIIYDREDYLGLCEMFSHLKKCSQKIEEYNSHHDEVIGNSLHSSD